MTLTREKIQAGWVQKMVAAGNYGVHVLTEAELVASRRTCLSRLSQGSDLWLFGYGSLIWNPCFEFADRRVAKAVGWHRRFCLWTHLGRGSPDRPALMLGLERGGSCRGVAFRVPAAAIEVELDIVWRREMVTAAYTPTWVKLATTDGPIMAVTFTINRRHERYAGRLDDARTIETLAFAEGPLGTNRAYLFNTVEHLAELGLRDRPMEQLCAAVRARRPADHERESGVVPADAVAHLPA